MKGDEQGDYSEDEYFDLKVKKKTSLDALIWPVFRLLQEGDKFTVTCTLRLNIHITIEPSFAE